MSDADRGPVVSDQEILAVFANADEQRLLTGEVADELPISAENLSDRLDDLHERRLLAQDEDDIRDDRWHLAPGAREEITISDGELETDIEAQATKTTGAEAPPHEAETPVTPPPDPPADPLEPDHNPPTDAIRAFDPPGAPEEKDIRREALHRAYTYLRKRGRAAREDLESDVFPEASGAYDRPDGWWEQVIRPGWKRFLAWRPRTRTGSGASGRTETN